MLILAIYKMLESLKKLLRSKDTEHFDIFYIEIIK